MQNLFYVSAHDGGLSPNICPRALVKQEVNDDETIPLGD